MTYGPRNRHEHEAEQWPERPQEAAWQIIRLLDDIRTALWVAVLALLVLAVVLIFTA